MNYCAVCYCPLTEFGKDPRITPRDIEGSKFPDLCRGLLPESEPRSSEKSPSRLSRESGKPVFLDSGSRSLSRAWPE
jgi:hypothetical protein